MTSERWNKATIQAHYQRPLFELVHDAYQLHRQHFKSGDFDFCTLSSIKTGRCPEDCAYCPQSAHYNTGIEKEPLLDIETISQQAKQAKANGSQRFCMGAAWRTPPKKAWPQLIAIIKTIKSLGLETCMTLGKINQQQADELKQAGLDYYNHNIDTSPRYYEKIITTRCFQDRLDTLTHVSNAGLSVCCGGIVGMGETQDDRIEFLLALLSLPNTPKSIPINQLIPIPGTPLGNQKPLDAFEFIRTIAITRMMFPQSKIRLSAGREAMSEEMQAWCFMAGSNSIFLGDKLLTANNRSLNSDATLLKKLGLALPTVKESCHAA